MSPGRGVPNRSPQFPSNREVTMPHAESSAGYLRSPWFLGLSVAGILATAAPPARAQGGAAEAAAVAGVIIETIGGLSSWLEHNSDDCAVATAAAAWGQHCSLMKEECTDTGWFYAECETIVENSCGKGQGKAYAEEDLIGMWWEYVTKPEVSAQVFPLHGEQDRHGASGWAKAQVDGTSRAKSVEAGSRTDGPIAASRSGRARSGRALGRVDDWPEGTVIAVAFFDSVRLAARAGSPEGCSLRARFDVPDLFTWETYVHLDGSGTLTTTGGIPESAYSVVYDGGSDAWRATLFGFRVEFPVDTLETSTPDSIDVPVHMELDLMASDANASGPEPPPVPVMPADLKMTTPDGVPTLNGMFVAVVTPVVAIAESAPFGPFFDTNLDGGGIGFGVLDIAHPLPWQTGDQIQLLGHVTHHEGRTVLTSVQGTVTGMGLPVPPPLELPIVALLANAEQIEGRRVLIRDCSLLDPNQWPQSPKEIGLVRVEDPSGGQIDLEILAPPERIERSAPLGPFHATGMLQQKDPDGAPYNAGYRIRLESIEETAASDAPGSGAGGVAGLEARPNPAARATVVTFELRREGPVRLSVLDPQGRRVRSLASGTLRAGVHSADWDLRDEGGQRVAPGVYFVHLAAGEEVETRKLTIAR
jgi:hypothetical protein